MGKGRPQESPQSPLKSFKFKDENSEYCFDVKKNPNGCHKCEAFYPKGYRAPKVKITPNAYGKMPVVVAFKTSNRSNAKFKVKVFNQSIDYVIKQPSLPGISDKAIILDMGVGESFIEKFNSKYIS